MINELTGLSVDGLNRALALRQISVRYDFRIVDELGAAWSLSNGAVMNRSRSFDLDAGTWKLSLTILKARIPAGLTVSQYQQIQVDRGIGGGLWAYFRGVIQSIRESTTRRGGSIVEVLELECEGVLSKLRGIYVPSILMPSTTRVYSHCLLGIARTITNKLTIPSITTGDKFSLSGESHVYLRELDASGANPQNGDVNDTNIATTIALGKNASFSSVYVRGTDYTVNTTVVPYQIEWLAPAATASPVDVWVRYRVVDKWVQPKVFGPNLAIGTSTQTVSSVPSGWYAITCEGIGSFTCSALAGTYNESTNALFYLSATTNVTITVTGTLTRLYFVNTKYREAYFLNDRRDYANLLQTTVASVDTGAKTITPLDASSYIQGVSNLPSGGVGTEPGLPASGWLNREFVTVTFANGGLEVAAEITAINRTTGAMTFAALPVNPLDGVTVVSAGDRIRLSTLEHWASWNDGHHQVGFLTTGSSAYVAQPQSVSIFPLSGMIAPNKGATVKVSSSVTNEYEYHITSLHAIVNRWLGSDFIYTSGRDGPRAIEILSGSIGGSTVNLNSVEHIIRIITSKNYFRGPLEFSEWIVDATGVCSKPYRKQKEYLDRIVSQTMEDSFPANVRLRDRVDGNVRIGPITQATVPAYVLPGIASAEVQDNAERVTSLTVVSDYDATNEINIASSCFGGVGSLVHSATLHQAFTNPERMYNGDPKSVSNVNVATPFQGTPFAQFVWWTIPAANPMKSFSRIKRITIKGTGLILSAFYKYGDRQNNIAPATAGSTAWTSLSGFIELPDQDEIILTEEGVTLDGDVLDDILSLDTPTIIAFGVRQILSATAYISEVEIIQENIAAHTAQMTDNTSLSVSSPVNSLGFGTTWSQPDGRKNVSFRYAPTAWMKRNAAKYGPAAHEAFVTNRGSGYTSAPTVTLTGGTSSETWTAYVRSGVIDFVQVFLTWGNGYTTYPTVTVSGGGGSGASIVADIVEHRTKIIRLSNLSQMECRTYAENYMDEYLRSHLVYTVQAPLLDYAEPGDTVLVQLPDGSQKPLLLWGITDSGGPGDNMATYTLRDYSL